VIDAALGGFCRAYAPEEIALPHLKNGRLKRVLEKWSPYWNGYHLYYPSRRQSSPASLPWSTRCVTALNGSPAIQLCYSLLAGL
jgi:DNA-binding transcriptional LysR family regulator